MSTAHRLDFEYDADAGTEPRARVYPQDCEENIRLVVLVVPGVGAALDAAGFGPTLEITFPQAPPAFRKAHVSQGFETDLIVWADPGTYLLRAGASVDIIRGVGKWNVSVRSAQDDPGEAEWHWVTRVVANGADMAPEALWAGDARVSHNRVVSGTDKLVALPIGPLGSLATMTTGVQYGIKI